MSDIFDNSDAMNDEGPFAPLDAYGGLALQRRQRAIRLPARRQPASPLGNPVVEQRPLATRPAPARQPLGEAPPYGPLTEEQAQAPQSRPLQQLRYELEHPVTVNQPHGLKAFGEGLLSVLFPRAEQYIQQRRYAPMLGQQERERNLQTEAQLLAPQAQPVPATVESGGLHYQYNPKTDRFDIPIGERKPPAEGKSAKSWVTDTRDQKAYYLPAEQIAAAPAGTYVPYKAPAADSGKPVAGSIGNKPTWGIWEVKNRQWVSADAPHQPLAGFVPPPSWAEVMPATRTTVLTDPATGLPTTVQYNTATGTFDKPVGTAGGGAYAHQIQAATALTRMVNENVLPLVDTMAQKGELGIIKGRFSDWLNRSVGNAPPDVAQLHQLINGVVSMMMGMYGFRRQQAVELLAERMGARMTPESLRASMKGILQHAASIIGGAVNPQGEGGAGQGPTYVYKDGKLVKQ